MVTFSERLKELRIKNGLSLRELAKLANINHSTISSYEMGRRIPRYECLVSLAKVLDCKIEYLTGESDDARKPSQSVVYGKKIYDLMEAYRNKYSLSRDEIEQIIDWDGLYDAIQNNTYTFDEGILITINNMLDINSTPDENNLTEGEKEFLNLFRMLPEEEQRIYLEMLRARLNARKAK